MLCLVLAATLALAGSPLTSTDLATAYDDVPIVRVARRVGILNPDLAMALASREVPMDVKAAIVNALGWSTMGRDNAGIFLDFMAVRYRRDRESMRRVWRRVLSPSELFVLGYLHALDDPAQAARAIPILERAARRMPESYTVALVGALVQAQTASGDDICEGWRRVAAIDAAPRRERDLRPAARAAVLGAVRADCPSR